MRLRRGADESDRARLGEDLGGCPGHGSRLSFAHGRSSPRRLRPVQRLRLEGREPRAHGAARRPRGVDRGRPRPPARRSGTGSGRTRSSCDVAEPLDGGETVEAMSAWAKQHGITLVGGSIVERREGREKLSNTCVVFDPEGEISADLPQDPHVRRRGRRPGLPRVGQRGAGRRPDELRGRGLEARADGLLRPALPRAVPHPRRRGRGDHHGPGRVHALHGQGPLGAPPARPGGREPVLRRRRQPVGRARGRQGLLRPQLDHRPLGRRARAGARRGLRSSPPSSTGRTWSASGAACPSLANRQPAAYTWPAEV